ARIRAIRPNFGPGLVGNGAIRAENEAAYNLGGPLS
ncbi:MAG: hypothetical protein QOJ93_247, partial [Actinomycetota bacterium]|nr:hypothetical protein [Actinomycetota bacterium]